MMISHLIESKMLQIVKERSLVSVLPRMKKMLPVTYDTPSSERHIVILYSCNRDVKNVETCMSESVTVLKY